MFDALCSKGRGFAQAVPIMALTACSPALLQELDEPTAGAVIDYMSMFSPYSAAPIQTGGDYVWAGYAYVDYHCSEFFRGLELGRMRLAFARDTSVAGFGAANSILALVTSSQKSIGIVGAAGMFVSQSIANYSNDYYFNQFSGVAQYSGELWVQTTSAQNHYKFENAQVTELYDQISRGPIGVGEVQAKAHNIVQGYARLCTLQQMQVFIQTALTGRTSIPAASSSAIGGARAFGGSGSGAGRGSGMSAYVIR